MRFVRRLLPSGVQGRLKSAVRGWQAAATDLMFRYAVTDLERRLRHIGPYHRTGRPPSYPETTGYIVPTMFDLA